METGGELLRSRSGKKKNIFIKRCLDKHLLGRNQALASQREFLKTLYAVAKLNSSDQAN